VQAALHLIIAQQSGETLDVVGGTGGATCELDCIGQAQPDVVVLVVGLEVSRELHLVAPIRRLALGCRVLLVDTLGEARTWQATGWDTVDALLCTEHLATALVPTLHQLVAARAAARSPSRADDGWCAAEV
jgi:hypothetical protein